MCDIEFEEISGETPESIEMYENDLNPFNPPVEEVTIDDVNLFAGERWSRIRFYLLEAKGIRIDKVDYILRHEDEIVCELRTLGLLDDESFVEFHHLLTIVAAYADSIEPERFIEINVGND